MISNLIQYTSYFYPFLHELYGETVINNKKMSNNVFNEGLAYGC